MTEWDDQLDAYLNGTLPAEEVPALEQQLREDAALAAELDFRRSIREALIQEEGQKLRARIQSLTQEAAPKSRPTLWIWGSIAASILLLMGLVWMLRPITERPSPDDLFAQYLDPVPQFDVQRTAEGDSLRNVLLSNLYARGDFAGILTILGPIADTAKSLDELYLEAIAQAKLHQDLEALSTAEIILQTQNAFYQLPTLRLKSLIHIKLGQYTAAKSDIQQLESLHDAHWQDLKAWLEDAPRSACRDCD